MRKRLKDQTIFILVSLLAALTAIMFGFISLFNSSSRVHYSNVNSVNTNTSHISTYPSFRTWEREISDGDVEFTLRNYSNALAHYQKAKEKLRIVYNFEKDAPDGRKDRLQYYYNRERFIDTRLEFSKICLELNN